MWICLLIFILWCVMLFPFIAEYAKNYFYFVLSQNIFSKLYWINLWHQFLISIKWKKILPFPFDIKKYITKNASIKLQIKLFQTSKQLQQIIQKHRGKQCGKFYLGRHYFSISVDATNIVLKVDWNNKFLSKSNPLTVKEMFSTLYMEDITNEDFEELYPKLDLTELKRIKLHCFNLSATVIQQYLVPSLLEIDLYDVYVEDFDLPLFLLEQCPLATKIEVFWHKDLTSMTKLAAIKRKTKLKKFELHHIPKPIHIEDIIDFVNLKMDTEPYLVLDHDPSATIMNPDITCISYEETMEIVEERIPSFSKIFVFCYVTK